MNDRARILVVDDEPHNLELLVRMLRRTYDVVTASSGREALSLLSRQSFAAILTDQRMPEMTGTEFLTQARHLVPETVRMILTGYAPEKESVDAINEAHVATFLTKPVAPETVQRAVADAVELYEAHLHNQRLEKELAVARARLERDFDGLLAAELARVTRYGGVLALVLILVDNGELAAGRLRASDIPGRLEGHTAILMPGTPRAGARTVCMRLGLSHVGVAEAPKDGMTRDQLVTAALSDVS